MDASPPALTSVVTPAAPSTTSSTSTTTSVVTPPPPPPSTRFDWPEGWSDLDDTDPLWEGIRLSRTHIGPAVSVYDDGSIRSRFPRVTSIMDIGADNGGGWTLFFRNSQYSTSRLDFKFNRFKHPAETTFTVTKDLGFIGGFEASSLAPVNGPPYDDSFFDHHSVKVWSFEDFSQGISAKREVGGKVKLELGAYGFIVHGDRTGPSDPMDSDSMPTTGTLTYRGAAGAYVDPGRDESVYLSYYYSHSHVARYEGDLTLEIDLGNPTTNVDAFIVDDKGKIDNLKYRPFGEFEGFQALPEDARFVIDTLDMTSGANAFTATIREENVPHIQLQGGSVSGRFYGPGAAEVGGTFRGFDGPDTATDGPRVIGWFRGAGEQPGTPGP